MTSGNWSATGKIFAGYLVNRENIISHEIMGRQIIESYEVWNLSISLSEGQQAPWSTPLMRSNNKMFHQLKLFAEKLDPHPRSSDFHRSARNAAYNKADYLILPIPWFIATSIFVSE